MANLPDPFTQEQLLSAFSIDWDALMLVVDGFSPEQMLSLTDASGWNARDHIAHLEAWLRSVVLVVRDRESQWIGLGISEDLFGSDDIDRINEELRQQTIAMSPGRSLDALRASHDEMVGIVQGMSDADLLRPANDYMPGKGDFAICYLIDGDGPHHYREHTVWLQELLDSGK